MIVRPPELLVEPKAEPNPILELDDAEEEELPEELLDEPELLLLFELLPERGEDGRDAFDDELRLPLVPLPASTSIRSSALAYLR